MAQQPIIKHTTRNGRCRDRTKAGFGAVSAAPIARRVFDYWLLGHYPSEEDMAATQKGLSGRPIGTPRSKKDVPLIEPKSKPQDLSGVGPTERQ